MKDMLEHLARLREQIVKCEQLRDAAKSQIKRAAFDRVVSHYKVLASVLESESRGRAGSRRSPSIVRLTWPSPAALRLARHIFAL
ncbi:hypothetical protein [Bradyrhizobium arachidis]|uniref:hypothetical protein n=1 Tax=Bradyrhizobium arachidis TaxID=858423 RepID=UPI0011608F27|nr:hypothetical protein [Bradyrhizobium arachidis]